VEYTFESELFEWQGKASWFFVTLPPVAAEEIKEISNGLTNGFGSVRVDVSVGPSHWRTSIFPHSKVGSYMLPIKQEVRKINRLATGDSVTATIKLVDF
jgi:hypothetical protein